MNAENFIRAMFNGNIELTVTAKNETVQARDGKLTYSCEDLRVTVQPAGKLSARKNRRAITIVELRAVFCEGSLELSRIEAVAELVKRGFGKSAAYSALNESGPFGDQLKFKDGLITVREPK